MNAQVHPPLKRQHHQRLRSLLQGAVYRWDSESNELNVVLPSSAKQEGDYILVNDEFYVRCDFDTGQPLTIIIPSFTAWLSARGLRDSAAHLDEQPDDAVIEGRIEQSELQAPIRAAWTHAEQVIERALAAA